MATRSLLKSTTATLYTLGYEKRTLREFIEILAEADIHVLVDVRETAWSHKPGFSKGLFQAALERAGIEYVHASFAGNPKWLRSNAASHAECLKWYVWYLGEFGEIVDAFDALVRPSLRAGKRVCLTCFERHADDCHRAILAARWEARTSKQVVHLATDGCRRLVQPTTGRADPSNNSEPDPKTCSLARSC